MSMEDDIRLSLTAQVDEAASKPKIQASLDRLQRQVAFQIQIKMDSNQLDREISAIESKLASVKKVSNTDFITGDQIKEMANYNTKLNEAKELSEQIKEQTAKVAHYQELVAKNSRQNESNKSRLAQAQEVLVSLNQELIKTENKLANIRSGLSNIVNEISLAKDALSSTNSYNKVLDSSNDAKSTVSNLGIGDDAQIQSAIAKVEELNNQCTLGTKTTAQFKAGVEELWDTISTKVQQSKYQQDLDDIINKNRSVINSNQELATVVADTQDKINKFGQGEAEVSQVKNAFDKLGNTVTVVNKQISEAIKMTGLDESLNKIQTRIDNLGIGDNAGIVAQLNKIQELGLANTDTATKTNNLKIAIQELGNLVGTQEQFQKYQGQLANIVKENKDLITNNEQLKQSLSETQQVIENFGKGKATDSQVDSSIKSFGSDIKVVKKEISDAGSQADTFGDKIKAAFSRFTVFTIASTVIMQFINGVKQAIQYVTELDSVMSEFRYVTGMSKDQVDDLRSSFSALGEEVGATTEEVANAALEYVRQGKSISESMDLATESLKLSKLAAIDSAQSTEYLTSAVNGYRQSGITAAQVVDKLVSVDNVAATSSAELAEAMSKTASSAELSGVTMDKLLGYIGTVSEVTRGSAESIGNSFKTIFARMEKVTNSALSSSGAINDVETALNGVGVQLRDSDDSFRSTGDVLDDLAAKWNDLSETQQQNIAYDIAGVRQKENFIVLMQNYERSLELTATATDSAGLADARYSAYLESVTGKQKSMQAAAESLIDTFLNSKAIGYFYDLVKAIINVVSSFQQLTAGMGVWITTGLATWKVLDKFNKLDKVKDIITMIGTPLANSMGIVSKSALVAAGATQSFTAALGALSVVIGAVVAAFVAWNAIDSAFHLTLSSKTKYIDDLTISISDLTSEYQKLNAKTNRTDYQNNRLQYLQSEINLQKELLEIEKKEKYQQEASTSRSNSYNNDKSSQSIANSQDIFSDNTNYVAYNTISGKGNMWTSMESYKEIKGKYDDLQQEIKNAGGDITDKQQKKIEDLNGKLIKIASSWESYIKQIKDYNTNGEITSEIDTEMAKSAENITTELGMQIDSTGNLTDATADLADIEDDTYTTEQEDHMVNFSTAADNATSSISDLKSAISDISTVMTEMNDSGQLSISTLIALMSSNSELIGFLQEENGVYTMTQESMQAYFEYKKQATLADLELQISTAANEIVLAEEEIDANAISAQATVSCASVEAESANSIVSSYNARATAAMVAANAESIANATNVSASKFTGGTTEQQAQITAMKTKLSGLINSYKVLSNISYPDVISATNASTSATKANTEATNAAKEAADAYVDTLEDEQSKMNAIAKAIQKIIDKEIDQWQDKKDASDDYYDAEIQKLQDKLDLLQDEYDTEDKLLELEKAKQALEDAKNAKNTRLYTAGQGWQWTADPSEVASKQESLDSLQKEWDRDQEKKSIQSFIDKLEAEKKAVDATFDAEIKKLQDLKSAWSEATDTTMADLEKWEGALAYVKNFESSNYDGRISLLQSFTSRYQELARQIIEAQKAASIATSNTGSTTGSTVASRSTGTSSSNQNSTLAGMTVYGNWEYYTSAQMRRAVYQYGAGNVKKFVRYEYKATSTAASTHTTGGGRYTYATGGVDTHGGLATLHGTPNQAEVIFNAAQGKALFNFVNNLSKDSSVGKQVAGGGTTITIQNLDVTAPNNATIDTIITTARQKIRTQQ